MDCEKVLRTSYRPRAWEELLLLRSRARFGSARPGDAMNANRAPAEPDHDGREEAAAGQTKPRRSKGEPHRSIVTLEQLPLFADERSLSEAVLGHGQSTHWRAVVIVRGPRLSKNRWPYGRPICPCRSGVLRREYRVAGDSPVALRDGPEHLGAPWKKRDLKRR